MPSKIHNSEILVIKFKIQNGQFVNTTEITMFPFKYAERENSSECYGEWFKRQNRHAMRWPPLEILPAEN